MAEPFDTIAASVADVIDRLTKGEITEAQAATTLSPLLAAVNDGEFATRVEEIVGVVGRITGLLMVEAPPSNLLGAPGSYAWDRLNKVFYGPKDPVTGWPAGDAMTEGPPGPSIQLQVTATHIQWRVVGTSTWTNLIALSSLRGADGTDGSDGQNGDRGDTGPKGDPGPQGLKGDRGEAFTVDAQGTLAGRAAYDGEAVGFSYLDDQNGNLYFRVAAGGWSPPIPFLVANGALQPRPKTIVVLGSSNGAGLGASTYVSDPSESNGWASPATSWAGLLIAALKNIDSAWQMVNRSKSGTGTASAIARFWTDVAVHRPSHVIICTHPQNDGYDAATYINNTTELVRLCRSIGAVPILRGAYMSPSPTSAQYQEMLGMNRSLDHLNCHRIDHFSALDDGTGNYVGGSSFQIGDGLHPNDAGYAVLFTAIDLGLFLTGSPSRSDAYLPGAWTPKVASGAGLMLRPETGMKSTVRSFTMRARIKGKTGGASARAFLTAYYQGGIGTASPLRLRNAAGTYDLGDNVTTFTPASSINPTTDAGVHDLVVTYNHATNSVQAYVDGVAFATGSGVGVDASGVKAFTFGGRGEAGNGSAAQGYGFSDIAIWQVPLSPRAIAEMYRTNRKPRASLIFEGDLGGTPPPAASQGIVVNSISNGLYAEVRDATWDAIASY